MELAKSAIPDQIRPKIRYLYRTVRRPFRKGYAALRYRGDQVKCPCCGWQGANFLPGTTRSGVICPNCECGERHRFLWVYLDTLIPTLPRTARILHFAPEPALARRLRASFGDRYVSTDLTAVGVDVQADITALPFDEASFDLVICSHVLEHIPNEQRALAELHRVLAPGGSALILVPIYQTPGGATIEDPAITTNAERLRVYGQTDHVRKYGEDVQDRIVTPGWTVAVHHPNEWGEAAVLRHGLMSQDGVDRERIFRCTRATR